jgi:hypothetical protein
MKHLNRLLSGVTALLALVAVARAQSLSDVPTALLHVTTNDFQRGVNLQSQRGAPLSGTVGTPTGGDRPRESGGAGRRHLRSERGHD